MNPDDLGRLIDRHADSLRLYARQWTDMADDVVQEAFLSLARQRAVPENPAAWLFRAVRNGAINAAVAARRRRRHEERAAAWRLAGWFTGAVDDGRTGAGSGLSSGSLELDPSDAEAALKSLPLDQREVIVAHLWGGLTFEQIGEVSGTSSSTAHRLYAAGLATLRERLGVACPGSRTSTKTRTGKSPG